MTPFTPVVYVVDDDAILLEVLVELVESIGARARPFAAATPFLQEYTPLPCECVVSDMRMPDMTGLMLQRELRERHSVPPPLIFITGYGDVGSAVTAMKDGAFDYLEKPVTAVAFIDKLQAALRHSRDLHEERLLQSRREAQLALLTPREREILARVLQRQTNREIAEDFGCSVRTVENHRANILSKFRVRDTGELFNLFSAPIELKP